MHSTHKKIVNEKDYYHEDGLWQNKKIVVLANIQRQLYNCGISVVHHLCGWDGFIWRLGGGGKGREGGRHVVTRQ
jgi:hypothetical protein